MTGPRAACRAAGRALAISAVLLAAGPAGAATVDAIAPPAGRGPPVVVVSGASGRGAYRAFAEEVAALGYFVLLADGNDYAWGPPGSFDALGELVDRARRDPRATAPRAAVIGFSLGGSAAVLNATAMGDRVAAVVAYFPMIAPARARFAEVAARLVVPTLLLAAEDDGPCCSVSAMRAMQAAAAAARAPLELVVYVGAGHAFTQRASSDFRPEAARDSWRRAADWLRRYLPT